MVRPRRLLLFLLELDPAEQRALRELVTDLRRIYGAGSSAAPPRQRRRRRPAREGNA